MLQKKLLIFVTFTYSFSCLSMEVVKQGQADNTEKRKNAVELALQIHYSEKPENLWDTLNMVPYRKVMAVIRELAKMYAKDEPLKDESWYFRKTLYAPSFPKKGIEGFFREYKPMSLDTPWGQLWITKNFGLVVNKKKIEECSEEITARINSGWTESLSKVVFGDWYDEVYGVDHNGNMFISRPAPEGTGTITMAGISESDCDVNRNDRVLKWFLLSVCDRVTCASGLNLSIAACITSYYDVEELIALAKAQDEQQA